MTLAGVVEDLMMMRMTIKENGGIETCEWVEKQHN